MKSVRLATGLGMAVLVALTSLPISALAQETRAGGLTISPSLKELIIGPGLLEAKTTISVRNDTGKDLMATIRLVDFESLDEFGGVSLGQVGAAPSAYSLAKWMSLPNGESVRLPNNQTIEIPVAIRNDDDLSPGGHYGAAIVSVVNDEATVANEVSFKQELASLLFVKKTGGETYGIVLETIEPKNLPDIPASVTLKFKSTGNVHVIPRGYIEITDPRGNLIAKGIINPESTLVLPDKSRQFVTIMQPVAEAKLKGEYKITAYYRYDGMKDFEAKSITFKRGTAFVSTGIILLVGLLITGVTAWVLKKKKFKKAKKLHPFA